MNYNIDNQNDYFSWAVKNFGNNFFNDQRLTKRCVNIAEAIMSHPKSFINGLYANTSAIIGAYRFFQSDNTSFYSVIETHCSNTSEEIMQLGKQAQEAGEKKPVVLVLRDMSEINFGYGRKIKGAGPIGENNQGKGFVLHSNLALNWDTKQIIGLLSAMVKDRTPRPKRENGQALSSYQRALISDRESALWMNSKQDFKPFVA